MPDRKAVSAAWDPLKGALHRAKRDRIATADWTIDAKREAITAELLLAFDDRATLAAEVIRLNDEIADLRADRETVNLLRTQLTEEQDRVQRLCRAIRGVFTDKVRLEAAIREAVGGPADDPASSEAEA